VLKIDEKTPSLQAQAWAGVMFLGTDNNWKVEFSA